MPSRPGKESTGVFPHPALASRAAVRPKLSSSSDHLPPATERTPADDTDTRIRVAYLKYVELCRQESQPMVGEEKFSQRLRTRLAKLAERYPKDRVVFQPLVDDGVVRVRVLFAKRH